MQPIRQHPVHRGAERKPIHPVARASRLPWVAPAARAAGRRRVAAARNGSDTNWGWIVSPRPKPAGPTLEFSGWLRAYGPPLVLRRECPPRESLFKPAPVVRGRTAPMRTFGRAHYQPSTLLARLGGGGCRGPRPRRPPHTERWPLCHRGEVASQTRDHRRIYAAQTTAPPPRGCARAHQKRQPHPTQRTVIEV